MTRKVREPVISADRQIAKLRRENARLKRDLAVALERELRATSREAEALEQQTARPKSCA
jgi:hypothetical protein